MSLGTQFLKLMKENPTHFDVSQAIFLEGSSIRICDRLTGVVLFVIRKSDENGSAIYSSDYLSFVEAENIYKFSRSLLSKQKKHTLEELNEIYGVEEQS